MVSRPGKQTIAEYLCFSNGVKRKEYVPTDPMDFNNRPVEEIKERLRVELSNLHGQSSKAQALKRELDDLEGNKMLLTGKQDSKDKSMPHSRNNGRSATEANTNDHSMVDGEDDLGIAINQQNGEDELGNVAEQKEYKSFV